VAVAALLKARTSLDVCLVARKLPVSIEPQMAEVAVSVSEGLRMRLLLVFPFFPYPPNDGGRIGFFIRLSTSRDRTIFL